MVQVKVQRVSSVTDPETSRPGKQVELVEVRRRGNQNMFNMPGDESKMIQGILWQFQSLGFLPSGREMLFPKMTLTLSENEYELLGVKFEVNDVYELELKNGAISFRKAVEGV